MCEFAVCLAIVFVLVVAAASIWRDSAAFRARFPPISDDEFLARCRPGTNPTVALKVRRIVAQH